MAAFASSKGIVVIGETTARSQLRTGSGPMASTAGGATDLLFARVVPAGFSTPRSTTSPASTPNVATTKSTPISTATATTTTTITSTTTTSISTTIARTTTQAITTSITPWSTTSTSRTATVETSNAADDSAANSANSSGKKDVTNSRNIVIGSTVGFFVLAFAGVAVYALRKHAPSPKIGSRTDMAVYDSPDSSTAEQPNARPVSIVAYDNPISVICA
eukprot:TRINITY_DN138_c0_g1_i1.p1 TRINITY_DN138_c0_g1~~TRINITY_DN138_c0_g1_i1.p1  ORF type:complete len:257 (+),score=45.79 TRINITY_DN138_c0_g1_i1:116-772(+)